MQGKFELHDYWKHVDCMDAFICVSCVIQDTGEAAILCANWMCQGALDYWMCTAQPQHLVIKRAHYSKWKRHIPKGRWL